MSVELPPSKREPGRRGKQGETRARLIQVAIELLRSEGLAALTTSRITKDAGIAQPGFYAHFKNIEDIVQAAILHVLTDMRTKVREVRKRAFERLPRAGDLGSIEGLRVVYADTLEVFLANRSFAELFVRYRHDLSPLGGFMRIAAQRIRDELCEDIWRNVRHLGFLPEHRPMVAFWAEQVMALYMSAAEALLEGRYQDRVVVIDALARSSYAIMRANIAAVSKGLPQPIAHQARPE
jgi:AcrR family transcriptional regulator